MRRLLLALALLLVVPLLASCPRRYRRHCYNSCAYYAYRQSCTQRCEIYRSGICVAYREICSQARYCARYQTRCY